MNYWFADDWFFQSAVSILLRLTLSQQSSKPPSELCFIFLPLSQLFLFVPDHSAEEAIRDADRVWLCLAKSSDPDPVQRAPVSVSGTSIFRGTTGPTQDLRLPLGQCLSPSKDLNMPSRWNDWSGHNRKMFCLRVQTAESQPEGFILTVICLNTGCLCV